MTSTRYPTIIWDLDGTLIECGIYYEKALQAFTTFQAARTGLDPKLIRTVINQLDLAAVTLPEAWNRDRFPRSFYAASVALDVLREQAIWKDVPIDHVAAQKSWAIGDAVFDAPYEPYEGIRPVLEAYSAGGWQVLLWTKGDKGVQEQKLAKHDLDKHFDGVFVCGEKTTELLKWICDSCYVDLDRAWMVGDSLKDDIGPALDLGLGTVRVDIGNHSWSYNDAEHAPHFTVDHPKKVLEAVPDSSWKEKARVPKQRRKRAVGA